MMFTPIIGAGWRTVLLFAMLLPPTVVQVQGGFAGLDAQGNLVLNAGSGHNVSLLGDAMLVNGRDLGAIVAAAVQLQLVPLQVSLLGLGIQ